MKTKPWRKCLLHNWFVGCPSTLVQTVQTANWVKKTGFQSHILLLTVMETLNALLTLT